MLNTKDFRTTRGHLYSKLAMYLRTLLLSPRLWNCLQLWHGLQHEEGDGKDDACLGISGLRSRQLGYVLWRPICKSDKLSV